MVSIDRVVLVALLSPWVLAIQCSQAQTLDVLYSFTGGMDGGVPYSGLVRDAKGNFYGTTSVGGAHNYGAVFELTEAGKESVLYSFTGGVDGAFPLAGLVEDGAGNLYGTANTGGVGYGTVFELNAKTGKLKVLHTFAGGTDGAYPYLGALVLDGARNLYGTTVYGGSSTCGSGNGCGTVFKLDTNNTETILHVFEGGEDGSFPYAGLVGDAAGNFYGTTNAGASGFGTVFKLDSTGKVMGLHSFSGGKDGGHPIAGLFRDAKGNLYGTTYVGGVAEFCCGVVFKVNKAGKEAVLYKFKDKVDGGFPYAGLIQDSVGNLYGTTFEGGVNGWGTIFEVSAKKETVLYSFTGKNDGGEPYAGLIRDTAGNIYGTNSVSDGKACGYGACGVVFVLKVATTAPTGTVTFKDGSTTLGTGTIAKATGKASYSTKTLSTGSQKVYGGTTDISSSTSTVLVQTVN